MKRRKFVESAGILGSATLISPHILSAMKSRKVNMLKELGLQLFSVPRLMEKDLDKGLEMVAEMGYTKLELYGPYSFSAQSSKERWAALAPRLGFSASGFFGKSPSQFKKMLNEFNFTCPSAHTDLVTLENHMDELARGGEVLGYEYVVLPALPEENRKSLEGYKASADLFNKIGKSARDLNLKFAYHNHGYGLVEQEGVIPLQYLIENTDPDLVFLEMDLFWTTAGNADPVEYLKKYPGRYRLMHVKDMIEKRSFSGDGGDPSEWMELFPAICSAGDGIMELEKIIPLAQKNGVEHFIVEQDLVADPEVALQKSIDYLEAL